jgi:ABC-type transport system involved in multi-copper enzyme maturation permease subunit
MTFLPIVERELRVGARRKSTIHLRVWTAVAAIVTSFFFLVMEALPLNALQGGSMLFRVLSFYALGLCLFAGVFLSADVLSEEKRGGTLGLLFLTDLKGYDVVLGKFCAVWLKAFYALLSLLPVLALGLLLGGVTGGEFWRVSLALVNALFVSLAMGMLVSAYGRSSQSVLAGTFILLLVFAAAPIIADSMLGLLGWGPLFSWFSPAYPFSQSGDSAFRAQAAHFWIGLVMSHAVGWLGLVLAAVVLPRRWQDKSRAAVTLRMTAPQREQVRRRAARLLESSPVVWLVQKSGEGRFWSGGRALPLVLASVALLISILGAQWAGAGQMITGWLMWPATLGVKLLLAAQACRLFVEGRRSGLLELLVCSPLSSQEIISGQWRALKRVFFWPGVMMTAAAGLSMLPNFSAFASISMPAGGFEFMFEFMFLVITVGSLILGVLAIPAQLLALGWLGMWLGLSVKRPGTAFGFTVLFGLIVPPFVFCLPTAVIAVGLIWWARGKLKVDLREILLRSELASASPPALPPRISG